jgi:hypothetical protein
MIKKGVGVKLKQDNVKWNKTKTLEEMTWKELTEFQKPARKISLGKVNIPPARALVLTMGLL